MITIQLVRGFNGNLIGKSLSDRWNMNTLHVGPIEDDRNQSTIKKLRRLYGKDFRFTVVSGSTEEATPLERESLGSRFFSRLCGKTA